MANFGRFLLFSASMFSQRIANLVKGRKLRKPTKRWKAELGSLELRIKNDHDSNAPRSDSTAHNANGRKAAETCEAQTPSNLPARREAVSVFFNDGGPTRGLAFAGEIVI